MAGTGLRVVHTARTTNSQGHERLLDLCVGDITLAESPIDLICVSAFRGDYSPTDTSVIGALLKRGIDVANLKKGSEYMRLPQADTARCWISPLTDREFRRVLCFECTGQAAPSVGEVFRAITEHVLAERTLAEPATETPLDCVRMPLFGTGDGGGDLHEMLGETLRQGYIHLRGGLPVHRLQIVLNELSPQLYELLVLGGLKFGELDREISWKTLKDPYDLFISYRHSEKARVDALVKALERERPNLTSFIDRKQLSVGSFWKVELMEGLANSRAALCIITDDYPASAECVDEFHASMTRNIVRRDPPFLLPVFWLTKRKLADLPTSMRRVQGIDVRGEDPELGEIARSVLDKLPPR